MSIDSPSSVIPGAAGLVVGQRVAVDVAGREAPGIITDIDWRPSFNAQGHTAVTVDIDASSVVAPPSDISPR
ncbi:hypothetical protein [Halostella pelagica]|uniref:hypothetical protein n=1 Tax=Halostella pelagica TaxID=2583824 RepID=UPI001080BB7D|nr:hypothetical protein [Halostella pelagica]